MGTPGPARPERGDPVTTRTASMSAAPLPADREDLLRRLRLPHIRRHAPEIIATAKAQRWEPAEVLKALFAADTAEGPYRLVDAACEKRSVEISSNLHPAGLDELMPRP